MIKFLSIKATNCVELKNTVPFIRFLTDNKICSVMTQHFVAKLGPRGPEKALFSY